MNEQQKFAIKFLVQYDNSEEKFRVDLNANAKEKQKTKNKK